MNYNKYWTKEMNDKYRQMIKEKRSMDDIRDFFGENLRYRKNDWLASIEHPEYKHILPYWLYLGEMKVDPNNKWVKINKNNEKI